MGKTSIQWTDETWNPTRGCDKISPGCKHCYAETFAERFRGVKGHPYEQGFDLRLVPDKLDAPLRWKKPRMVFVNSMSDLFHEDVPNEYIAAVFGVMAACPQHTFQILTKRAERLPEWFAWAAAHPHGDGSPEGGGPLAAMAKALSESEGIDPRFFGGEGDEGVALARALDVPWPLPNVWLGVSVESQEYADARIPHLLRTPAAVRFLSCEPLLSAVDLTRSLRPHLIDRADGSLHWNDEPGIAKRGGTWNLQPIGWVIVGGESGAGARPMRLEWARSIVEQCKAAGVPAFVKQLGARPAMDVEAWRALSPSPLLTPRGEDPIIKDAGLVQLALSDRAHGGDPAEWPADLRVREFPEARRA